MFTSRTFLAVALSFSALTFPFAASAQQVGQVLDLEDIPQAPIRVPEGEVEVLSPSSDGYAGGGSQSDGRSSFSRREPTYTPRERGGTASLSELANPKSKFYSDRGTFSVEGPRKRIIEAAARGVGVRGGFANEAQRINKVLMNPKYRNALTAQYPFAKLMLQDGYIVPPVITKVSNVRELANQNYLALTVGSYEITREPRLATMKPTWMDYLLLPVRGVKPPQDIKLEGGGENTLWDTTVRSAWIDGAEEARSTFATALATLNRDYNGMLLYHQLAKQGAINIPKVDVDRVNWRVTPDGKRAYEGEVRIEIVVGPTFRPQKTKPKSKQRPKRAQ